jgi:two-component system chemotaxis response regulator CheY
MSNPITKLNVLVADSTSHMAGLIGQMLRALKVGKVIEVADSSHAVAELGRHPFGLVILDADLSGVNATELVRKLRGSADSPNRLVPIIMVAARTSASRIAAARDAGVTEFLRKPFAPSHLEARIRVILETPREFVEADAYAGPDRRRRRPTEASPQRRAVDNS